jgi:catechol 2,3-dioxygenase-like lactoylglutathione lyase family enzyme
MVHDMEASLDFYVNKLSFKVTSQWTPRGKVEWCWLQREAVSLMLQQPRNHSKFYQQGPKGNGVSICFQCGDALPVFRTF